MPGSEHISVYDTVVLQQTGNVKDIIVAEPDTAYLLTDEAVCLILLLCDIVSYLQWICD